MRVNVPISANTLNWIMAHACLDKLPNPILENLNAWKAGTKTPTFHQIETTSKATGIPLGYFFLKTPPTEELPLVEHRTVDSVELKQPSRNLIDTMHSMEMIQDWTKDYLLSEGESPLNFVGSFKKQRDILPFASSVRTLLDISADWFTKVKNTQDAFRFLRDRISNVGVIVMLNGIVGNNTHRPLEIDEFRAFAMLDEYAPLIFINSNDSAGGKVFSLLHEFVHLCIGESSLFNDRYSNHTKVKRTETICNAVAAEILVPQSLFIQKWKDAAASLDSDQAIQTLAKFFKCSITVIARKAFDNKFIDYATYDSVAKLSVEHYNEMKKREKENDLSGGDFYRTTANRIDSRFFNMLLGSVSEGKTLYSDAFRLTNTNRSTFAKLAEKREGGQ